MSFQQSTVTLGNDRLTTEPDDMYEASGHIFDCTCKFSPQKKIVQKEEAGPLGKAIYKYSYDGAGRLEQVIRNSTLLEQYSYDEEGRRIEDFRASHGYRQFIYQYDGALIRINDAYIDWSPQGRLAAIYANNTRVEYEYGNDTRLDRVFLPSGTVIQYEYGNSLMPVKVLDSYESVLEYEWKDYIKLQYCIDHKEGISYSFSYGETRIPQFVMLKGPVNVIHRLTGHFVSSIRLRIWVDQVGSIRVLSTENGTVVKCLEYDAFGNVTHETRPEWSFPLGFAGGLHDVYTGFIRFGFRDYDPQVGRFTAKDPLGYTGGDNDLWEYCVDDPISKIDPFGLEDRSLWERILAGYSPLLFGNEEEQRQARQRLHNSLKKEADALAGGYVEMLTIVPKKIPTSLGGWIIDNATSIGPEGGAGDEIRKSFIKSRHNATSAHPKK